MHLDALEIDSHQFLEIRAADFASTQKKTTRRAVSFSWVLTVSFFFNGEDNGKFWAFKAVFFGGGRYFGKLVANKNWRKKP